ncbi:MAG: lysylphosphatidylglycerol synthase transmembrane domain-containing protein [Gemmatimonadales bacterium]
MTTAEPRWRRALKLTLGIAVSAAMVWYAFKDQPFQSVWAEITEMHVTPMLGAIVLATLCFPLRLPRWRALLRRDDGTPVSDGAMWHAIAIGFAANNTLPFRAGEVLRVAVVSRLGRIPFATALSSLAVERVLDALVVVALLVLGLLNAGFGSNVTLPGSTAPIATTAVRVGMACAVALGIAALAAACSSTTLKLLDRILPQGRFGRALHDLAARMLGGLKALRDPRLAGSVAGWSAVIWLVNAAAFWIGFRAFDIVVPFTAALILQGVLLIGIAIPQAPGYAGFFELVIVKVLALYGVPESVGLAFALTYHVTTFIPITALGAWSATRPGITLKQPAEPA